MMFVKDLSKFVISSENTVREAFKKKDENKLEFILIEEKKKITGIVTDGDFYRAYNNSVDFDSPVIQIAKKNFIFINNKNSEEEIKSIFLRNKIRQIPVLENGFLKGIINRDEFLKKNNKDVYINDDILKRLSLAVKVLGNKKINKENKRTIIFFSRGPKFMILWETLLALTLSKTGIKPVFVVCNNLSICNFSSVQRPSMNCKHCFGNSEIPKKLGFEVIDLDSLKDRKFNMRLPDNLDELKTYKYDGINFGEQVKASVKRYFLQTNLNDIENKLLVEIYKRFISSSIITYKALLKVSRKFSPSVALLFNGVYSQMRAAFEAFSSERIRTITYESINMPKGKYWIFLKNKPVLDLDLSDEWKNWSEKPAPDKFINTHLKEKLVKFNEKPNFTPPFELSNAVLLLTSINWDLSSINLHSFYASMEEWVLDTIDYFIKTGKNLVIRIHPKDKDKYEQDITNSIDKTIRTNYKNLPSNIWVINSFEDTDTYTLSKRCKKTIVWSSTIGMEIALIDNKPVVLTDVHYSKFGFTENIKTKKGYYKSLESEKILLNKEQKNTAIKYYSFFLLRKRIPVQFFSVVDNSSKSVFDVGKFSPYFSDYFPKSDKYVEFVCNSILNKGEFVLPDNLL